MYWKDNLIFFILAEYKKRQKRHDVAMERIKAFNALAVHELYDLLQLEKQIFVVEQNCVILSWQRIK
jgi:hypothetical protein